MSHSAVMFGAGAVGRGFLGQLFSESGYEVIFVDVDEELIQALNASHAYHIHLVTNQALQDVLISPVHALNAKLSEAVAEAVAQADICATAVGARVLPLIAPLVADGISRRSSHSDSTALNIIICENLKDAAFNFKKMVREYIPVPVWPYFEERIGFVDTVIGRMVPPPTPVMRTQDPCLIAVEPYKELPVDRNAFKGKIPKISGMQACDNFPAYTARKLYIHNCGHALMGYLGNLKHYEFGYQALEDHSIRMHLDEAVSESITGIVIEYGVERGWLEQHRDDLIRRFANRALGDTIFRICRDPLRKLAPRDRLVGAARLAEKAGVKPRALAKGIAAAYCFNAADDPMAVELQKTIETLGIRGAMEKISGLKAEEDLSGLVLEQYVMINAEFNKTHGRTG